MVISEAYKKAASILQNADIESSAADSLILLCHTLNITKEKYILIKNDIMSENDFSEYMKFIERRAKKEPVKYITGICEFMGIPFKVTPGILIPRPDTEILVEHALSLFDKNDDIKICDLCCGSGCIGISMISFMKNAHLFSFDISDTAIDVSSFNAHTTNVSKRCEIAKKDILTENINEKFDIIVSNPPYISTEEYNNLMEDVKLYEPEIALHSPVDDLRFYRRIIDEYTKNLKEKGYLLFEVGYNQSKAVCDLIADSGEYESIYSVKDLSGIDRVVVARKS